MKNQKKNRKIKVGIKGQTPFYNSPVGPAFTYPLTDSQLKSVAINDANYFLATKDLKCDTQLAKDLNGRQYRFLRKEMTEYINENKHNQDLLKEDKYVKGKFRIIIPISAMTEVGRIDEKEMQESGITGAGTSDYSFFGEKIVKDYSKKSIDAGSVAKKGTTTEWLMKRYFEKQDGVEHVEILEDTYGPTDIIITMKALDKG